MLRKVADLYARSLDHRSEHNERTAILAEARLRLIVRDEAVEEARARFRILRDDLADVPPDVLREAVAAYARENKFFPAGHGELRPYTDRLLAQRRRTRWRLHRLADEAEKRAEEERRRTEDPLTPNEAARIIDEVCPFVRQGDAPKPVRHDGPPRNPTRADYLALGVSADALDAMGIV